MRSLEINLITALIGIVTGATGYWITTFWMQPILRYRIVRGQIHSQFIYYSQVINADGMNDELQKLYRERILTNRRSAAELSAVFLELPYWYILWLRKRGIHPEIAARHLIGYSNTPEFELANKFEDAIKRFLGLPLQA